MNVPATEISLPNQTKRSPSTPASRSLFWRLTATLIFLGTEWLPISGMITTGRGGQSVARAAVAFTLFFLLFGYFRVRRDLPEICDGLAGIPPRWKFLAGHALSMAAFFWLSTTTRPVPLHPNYTATVAWYFSGLVAIVFAGLVLIPPTLWADLIRRTGRLWILVSLCSALVVWIIKTPLSSAWDAAEWAPAIHLTFGLTAKILKPILPDLVTDESRRLMGTPHFLVQIRGACSGMEGVGLMLVFSSLWLWLFRAERRFPQAFLVLPISAAVIWLLNSVRIAILILIGNAGAPDIAMGGFHSQAGWIAFNIVGLSMVLLASKVPWWSISREEKTTVPTVNPTAWYLAPLLAIVAASMISRAGAGDFDWLYPIRLLAAAAILWWFRDCYSDLQWRPTAWLAPAAGAIVFLAWILFDTLHGSTSPTAMPAALAAASPAARVTWLFCRVLAAVVTVPVAEELAFRGFLIRRLISADFETLDLRTATLFAVLVSSLLFGLMHGGRWIEGSVAGLIYALILIRRGRIGDAVVAHSTTNGLIAIAVLVGGRWQLW